jgi:hypothetical protein
MKKLTTISVILIGQFCFIYGQNSYKFDFLPSLKKIPDVKTCEAAYNFFACKDNSCEGYRTTKVNISKAFKDIVAVQNANGNEMTAGVNPVSMSPEESKALSEKLDKMTPEEKQQWAMQNAQSYMNMGTAHANQDVDNAVVNDAVDYVKKQQQDDIKNILKPVDLPSQFNTIEDKYKKQKTDLLKAFQLATKTDYDPLWPHNYVFGEANAQEAEKFDKEVKDYIKKILPVYNAEMNDKLAFLATLKQNLVTKYTTTEDKIAKTHYADDAMETMNKNLLLSEHQTVLSKVMDNIQNFEDVFIQYANIYADFQKIEHVKGFETL